MATLVTSPRHIACDGTFNLRDLGGYETADGRVTRWRTVYRADGLHRVPPSGTRTLRTLGWKTVIDLRTSAEVEAGVYHRGRMWHVHLPVVRHTWEARAFDAADDAVPFLVDRYLEMLDEGAVAIASAIEILASPRHRPTVFHCSAGKDRTGVVAGLLLSTLGVPDHVVADDYHLSADAMDKLVAWVTATRPDLVDAMAQQPPQFMLCPPEAMLGLLAEVRERFGSAEGYLANAGVVRGTIDALREQLLEAPAR